MLCCEICNTQAQMSKTIIAVRHFELGGHVSLETAVIASKNYQCTSSFCIIPWPTDEISATYITHILNYWLQNTEATHLVMTLKYFIATFSAVPAAFNMLKKETTIVSWGKITGITLYISQLRKEQGFENVYMDIISRVCTLQSNLKTQCHLLSDLILSTWNLKKVRELFQVCRICARGVVFYNMAKTAYYMTKVSDKYGIFNLYEFVKICSPKISGPFWS